MSEKWYNSKLAEYVGVGILLFGLFTGMGSCLKGCGEQSYWNSKNSTKIQINRAKLNTIEKLAEKGIDIKDIKELTNNLK